MGVDHTVEQRYDAYTDRDHQVWAQLLSRQSSIIPGCASPEFIDGVEALQLDSRLPRFDRVSERLVRQTRWRLVGVEGLIPERDFFAHLARREFPVTVWIRRPDQLDYLPEPDLFHDFFGHVPLLADPAYADFIELYGHAGQRALQLGGLRMLARLYWYGVEFGLIETPAGLRTYGAGILSSFSETRHSLESAEPNRIRFDLERVMTTDYEIDRFQRTYFVVRSFRQLVDTAVNTDFAALYARHTDRPGIHPGTLLPTDEVLHRGVGGHTQS